MRKRSHDGGDSTSITSGAENEVKKSAMKTKKSSLKRKTPSFSQESDDTVIEPLLQRDPEKTDTTKCAKYFTKGKTDSLHDKESDKAKLLNGNKVTTTSTTGFCGTTESLLSMKDCEVIQATSAVVAPTHNYMNTNVFNNHDNSKVNVTTKSQILVEIDGSKQSGYTTNPLIFTTAKIHTDGKSKHMEPVQVTPVPILSTIEVSMSKGGSFTTNEKKYSNGSSVINPICPPLPFNKGKEEKVNVNTSSTATPTTTNKETFGTAATTISSSKLSSNTSVRSSFMGNNNLPSTSLKSFSITITKDKHATTKDNQNEQSFSKNIQPQIKTNLDNIKSNVNVMSTTPSSGKVNVVEMSIKPTKPGLEDSQTHKTQIKKLSESSDGKSFNNLSSNDSLQFVTNIKSPTASKKSTGISDPIKNVSNIVGNKQLQRQKTTTEETRNIEPKIEPSVKHSEDLCAKTSSSTEALSYSEVIESISSLRDSDKSPKICANNTQSIVTKSSITTSNATSDVTPLSVTTKPTVTCVSLSNTVTTPNYVSSKPFLITPSNTEKTESSISNLTSAPTNINNINIANTTTISLTKSSTVTVPKTSAIPTSISTVKSPVVTVVHPASSVTKTVITKPPMVSTSTILKTAPVASTSIITKVTSMTTTAVTSASITAIATTPANSISKAVAKSPSVTTSIKTKMTPTTKPPVTSVGSGAVMNVLAATTSITMMTSVSTAPLSTTLQNTMLTQVNASKQSISTTDMSADTKIPTLETSAKLPTVNTTFSKPTIKSPNNNSSPTSESAKPSSPSIAKNIPSVTKLAQTSAGSSSSSVAKTATVKSPQEPSYTVTKKGTSTSVKKPIVTKNQSVTTKTPLVSSVGNTVVSTTSKIPSFIATPVSTTNKQPATTIGQTVLAKSPSVTTSIKTPSVTSVSSTTSSTTTKPSTLNTTQVNSNKPVAGASVSSSSSIPQQSESFKKSLSKSKENNKKDKISKAEH